VRLDLVSHNYALAQKAIADAELNLRSDPDHRSIPGKFTNALKEIREEYSTVIFDPSARHMFERKMAEYGTAREVQMKYYTWERETEVQQAHLIETLHGKYEMIESLPLEDVKSHELFMAEGIDAINEKVATGMISFPQGTALRKEFREKAAQVKARQNVVIDPADAARKLGSESYKRYFPGLNAETRITLFERSENLVEQNYRQQTALEDKMESMAAAEEKQRLGANYGNAVILYSQDELTAGFLEEAIANRDLDPEKGYKLIRRLQEDQASGGRAVNNPIVVGDLAQRIALGEDVNTALDEELAAGNIKGETYVTMKANVTKDDVKNAFSYINKAMQPSEYEMDFNLKQSWADAIDLLNERIAKGEDPMRSARQIVKMRRKRLPTPPAGRPRYLSGDVTKIFDLEMSMRETVDQYKAGRIGPVEANQEVELIERHMDWL
jgi:hypothetical protein